MCHEFQLVKLGENINFITGRNGSGKSAVLTALTVALGGKSSFTNRATSISKLLKEGKDAGEVIVKIRNKGPDAYKPDVYGDTIIISRKLAREGSGSYKIKSASEKTISTRRDEITNICDHLNIEVDNPMTILTQDTARMFLANSTPQQKYQFFLKGTQLEKLDRDYDTLEEKVHLIQLAIRRKETVMPDIKKQLHELEKQWKDLEKVREMEENVNQLEGEKIWCKVSAIEVKRDNEKAHVEELVNSIQKQRDMLEGLKDVIEDGTRNIGILTERVKESQQMVIPLEREGKDIYSQIRLNEQDLEELNGQVQSIQKEIGYVDKTIADYESRVQREAMKLNSRGLSQANDRDHQIKVLHDQIKQQEETKRKHDQRLQEIEQEGERMANHQRELEPQIQRKKQELGRMQSEIKELQNRSTDHLSKFGTNVPRVLHDIENLEQQRRWKGSKPLGPLGRYIKLRDQSYGQIIETTLNKSLNAFSVDNHEDARLLRTVLGRSGNDSPIYIYKQRGELDFSRGRPSRELKTIYDFLEVQHPIVLDQLIINNQIEKIVLVSTHEEGDRLTAGAWPQNVQSVYSKDCYEFGNKQGGLQTRSLNIYRGPARLVADINQLVNQKQGLCQHVEEELDMLERKFQSYFHRNSELRDEKGYALKASRDAADRKLTLGRQIEKIKESMQNDDASQFNSFVDLLETEKQKREKLVLQYRDAEHAVSQSRVLLNERRAQFDTLNAHIADQKRTSNQIYKELEEIQMSVNKAKSAIDKTKRVLENLENEYSAKFESLKSTETILREQIKRCSEFCPRVETSRSEEEIEHELKRLRALVRRKEELYGSREAFYQKLVKKREIYKSARKDVQDFKKLITCLESTRRNRKSRQEQFRGYITTRAMRMFSELIKKRGYRGILELDHSSRTLALRVDINAGGNTEDNDHMDNGTDPKSLSGGEKSYATVCLLLALWEAMASPFRALDEFDVFMDAANRHLAMKLMVDHARSSMHRSQYILISPQGASQADLAGPDIRIMKMTEPERGQTTLNFSRN